MINPASTYIVVGASSGIGRSVALALARVAREVVMFGGEPLVCVSDVREPVSIQAVLAQVTLRNRRVEQAVLAAGVGMGTDADEFTSEALETMLDINVLGVANWLEALLPLLKAQPGLASVAVISSLSADRAFPGASAGYSASKAAVSQLCDGLRGPWARHGIQLVTVAPGFVRTPMTDGQAWLPALMEPDDAAGAILAGVRVGKSVVRFPRAASLVMGLIRLLPPGLLDKLDRVPQKDQGTHGNTDT